MTAPAAPDTAAPDTLSALQARTIIESLRKGTVPTEHVSQFTVGRERWLRYIRSDLDEYIAHGGSKVRFINGDYGDGKTHFMSLIQHFARESGYAVSFVVLTREIPLHRFEKVYQELIRQLRAGDAKGIRAIVQAWLSAREDGPAEPLRDLEGMDLSFANALIALVDLEGAPLADGESQADRDDKKDVIFRWLEGARIGKRMLKPYRIFESLDRTNNKRMLASVGAFMRHLGHKGLVLLLDEVETVMAQSARLRSAAFENIRLLIDSTDQSRYTHIFFSIIPDVLVSEKGFRSYDALWSRVRTLGDERRLNYRGVLIDLHRTPLGSEEFLQLGQRLRAIHGKAYGWDTAPVTDAILRETCAQQHKLGLSSEVRLFIRQLVATLDDAEQGNAVGDDIAGQLAESQERLEEQKRQQLGPRWDR